MTDAGGRAVPRIDADMISKGENLFNHCADQCMVIAAGKIRPAHGPCEEGVP